MRSTNKKAPVRCTRAITVGADSEKVWTLLSNINDWADWQTEITDPKLNGELKPQTTFQWKSGGAKIHSELHTVEPFMYLGWTGSSLGIRAIHNWTLNETEGKTEVTVDESMEGLLAGIFHKSLNRSLEKSLQRWLDLIKEECEK